MSEKASRIPFHVEINRIIELLAKQIYQSPLALLRENTQNAYDAVLQRLHLGQSFEPSIEITIAPDRIVVKDNGIGMTWDQLDQNYWKAGSSGKNNDEARAAGVVGTFGIGAMANFGAASTLEVVTESAKTRERTLSRAEKETLSAIDPCIDMLPQVTTGKPGTTVTALMPAVGPVNVSEAINYIKGFVQYLPINVTVNGTLISKTPLESGVPRQPSDWERTYSDVNLASAIQANITLSISKSGEIWILLDAIRHKSAPIDGMLVLRQGHHQIQTLRSRFVLAGAGVSSAYRFGGVANLPILQPTAGREAITTESMQFLQELMNSIDNFVSMRIAETPYVDMNTDFMTWAQRHGRIDLCGNLRVNFTPPGQPMTLAALRERSKLVPVNYYDGTDTAIIETYGTEETPLLVASRSNPRRHCEQTYIQSYCNVTVISNQPTVLDRIPERQWTLAQSGMAFRVVSALEADYFLPARVTYGKISHGLQIFVDSSSTPIELVLDPNWGTVTTILSLYDSDFGSFGGLVKDFLNFVIFPRVQNLVPSSTRQGAAAFLKAIKKPKDTFEYGKSDLSSLGEVWQDYLEGKITWAEAARLSTEVVRSNFQVVDRSHTSSVAQVAPDILENQKLLESAEESPKSEALPAITRIENKTAAKLLVIPEGEPALKGYRCFLAITDRVREERGDFFLQPHWTEIVWGGQKVLYIFQHHSKQFGLYYEIQTNELVSEVPGGELFATCTMVLGDTIFIPVPEAVSKTFIPTDSLKKRFEVRCDLLYPEISMPTADAVVES
jgi:molecular chaperone HtpG